MLPTSCVGAIIAAHWPVFLAAGAVGTGAGYMSSLIIKLSGATTLKVLAAVRGPLLVMSGVVLLSETVRTLMRVWHFPLYNSMTVPYCKW